MRDVITIVTWKEHRVGEAIRNRVVREVSFGQLPEAEQTKILEASRGLPLPALLDRHQATYRETLHALQTLTDDDLNAEDIDGLPPDERYGRPLQRRRGGAIRPSPVPSASL